MLSLGAAVVAVNAGELNVSVDFEADDEAPQPPVGMLAPGRALLFMASRTAAQAFRIRSVQDVDVEVGSGGQFLSFFVPHRVGTSFCAGGGVAPWVALSVAPPSSGGALVARPCATGGRWLSCRETLSRRKTRTARPRRRRRRRSASCSLFVRSGHRAVERARASASLCASRAARRLLDAGADADADAFSCFPVYSNRTEAKSRSTTQVHIILRSEHTHMVLGYLF